MHQSKFILITGFYLMEVLIALSPSELYYITTDAISLIQYIDYFIESIYILSNINIYIKLLFKE